MTRRFKRPDYEATLQTSIQLSEALPLKHLARFVVEGIAPLDLSGLYARYAPEGGEAIAPEILLGLLFYGYATGVFSSRAQEKGTYESIPRRFVASGLPPDHEPIAHFRKTFWPELQELFVQVLRLAKTAGVLKVGNSSLDGTKIHADASKSHAVSYKRWGEWATQLRQEVQELMTLGEAADQGDLGLPEGPVIVDEIALRQERLVNLAKAKAVLEARAEERYAAEKAAYEAQVQRRQDQARRRKRRPGGRSPKPPQPGARNKDQDHFSDPDSRLMKNSTDQGVDQHYTAPIAVTQDRLFMVAQSVSNHPNAPHELSPTLDALAPAVGHPAAVAVDNGSFSADHITACLARAIEPYLATGREPHQRSWQSCFGAQPTPPTGDASPQVKMAYTLQTASGQAIYRLRKCTVEPVIGLMKAGLGFRPFALRGLDAVRGEWGLVCLAFDRKRWHTLARA